MVKITAKTTNTPDVIDETTMVKITTVKTTKDITTMVNTTPAKTTTSPNQGCKGSLPAIDAPEIKYEVDSSKTFVSLECSFKDITSVDVNEVITYNTIWYVGLQSILVKPVSSGTFKTVIKSTEIPRDTDPVSNGLSCVVNISSTVRCGQAISPASKPIIANVEVATNKTYTLVEGEPAVDISVKLGVDPDYICLMKYGKKCQIMFTGIVTPVARERKCRGRDPLSPFVIKYQGQSPLSLAICGTVMKKSSESVKIKAVVDGVYFKAKATRTLKIKESHIVDELEVYQKLWDAKTIEVENKDFKNPRKGYCTITGDPHIRTFNSERYDNFMEGEFILYKRIGMEYEVRGFFTRCGFGSCMCAVAIRSGDDVVVFDKCAYRNAGNLFGRGASAPLDIRLYVKGVLTPGTKIYSSRGGSVFWVVLPIGTYIKIKPKFASNINVFIDAVASDIGNTEGACDYFSPKMDTENTLVGKNKIYKNIRGKRPNEFSKEWRVPLAESIYLGYKKTLNIEVPIYCSCVDGRENCGYFSDAVFCKSTRRMRDITDNLQFEFIPALSVRRKKRATPGGFTYDPSFGSQPTTTNPWPEGMTEADARGNCTAKLENTQAKGDCSNLLNSNFTEEIENCMEDIRLTGNTEWIKDVSSTIISNCEAQLNKETSEISESLQNQITQNLCDCSGRGTCTNGECSCNEGYTGDSCDVDMNATPIIATPTVCKQDNCSVIYISGINYFNSSTLSCYYTTLKAKPSGLYVESNTVEEKVVGSFLTGFQVTCPMRKQENVQIKLALKSTKSTTIAVYLTKNVKKCFTPNDTVNALSSSEINNYFTVKQSCCYIDETFYSDGEPHPINSECEICSSTASNSSWTYLIGKESCQKPRNEGNLTVIITSIVAVCVLLLILTFCGIFYAKWKKMRKPVTQYRSTLEEMEDPVYDGSYGISTYRTRRNLRRSLYS